MAALDVITFGEAMAMFVADEPGDLAAVSHFTRRQSGAEANVAIGLARLGLRVGWVSRVGDDSLGRFILQTMTSEGVDCGHVTVDKLNPTGIQLKSRAEGGADPRTEYFRKGSAASHLSINDFDPAYFQSARHLHASGVCCALSASTMTVDRHAMDFMRDAGKSVSFDPNLRPTLWPTRDAMVEGINGLAEKADWVLPGIAEGRILTPVATPADIAHFYLERGAQLVALKLGAEGAYFRTPDDEGTVVGIRVEHVVDTVGAGDAFAVGVISAMLEGLDARRAVTRGNRLGAMAIQVVGDMEGLPTRRELDAAEKR